MSELSEEQRNVVKDVVSGKAHRTQLANKTNIQGGMAGGAIGIAYAWYSGGSTIKLGIMGFVVGIVITAYLTSKNLEKGIKKVEPKKDE